MGQALQIVPALMQAKSAFKGPQVQQTKQLGNISNALVNPQNPLYQQLYGQNKQNNLSSLSQAITEMENHNRNLAANGRVPLFNPERGGEQAFRALAQQYQGNDQQARDQTIKQLMSGGAVTEASIPKQYDLTNSRNAGTQGIGNLLQALSGQQNQQNTNQLTAPSYHATDEAYGNPYNLPWKSYASAN